MKTSAKTGILGYGVYIPIYRIQGKEIARIWGEDRVPIKEKSVTGPDEDSTTMAVEAAKNAIRMARIDSQKIGSIRIGTESKPYAVKPTATIVAEAIGATPNTLAADLEFACKAGTEALQVSIALVATGMVDYAMAIGVDTAQARPKDALEYTAGCGAAAYIVSRNSSETVAFFEGMYSYVTDTPDFWRREGEFYPRHTGRFTGAPAYFRHIMGAAKGLMQELGIRPSDIDYVVFHQPNVKFPLTVARMLGFKLDKVKPGLLCDLIGNTYAASTLIGLAKVLDVAKPGQRILAVSFGSGAGSDAFSIIVQEAIEVKRNLVPRVEDYVSRKMYVDYALYARYRGKLRMR